MKVVRQWSVELDQELWRVVSDERGEQLRPMLKTVWTADEFAEYLSSKGTFIVTRIPGSVIGV
jgi:hypothetical protein